MIKVFVLRLLYNSEYCSSDDTSGGNMVMVN